MFFDELLQISYFLTKVKETFVSFILLLILRCGVDLDEGSILNFVVVNIYR